MEPKTGEKIMELHDLDNAHLVVSYTIQILFIGKSANSPKLAHPFVALTDTDNFKRNRT